MEQIAPEQRGRRSGSLRRIVGSKQWKLLSMVDEYGPNFTKRKLKNLGSMTVFTTTSTLLTHAGSHIRIALHAAALGWTPNSCTGSAQLRRLFQRRKWRALWTRSTTLWTKKRFVMFLR
jgi:hypothetical protein